MHSGSASRLYVGPLDPRRQARYTFLPDLARAVLSAGFRGVYGWHPGSPLVIPAHNRVAGARSERLLISKT